MPDIHLPIGTSSVHRLIACPASYQRSKKAPKGGSSAAADEGTLLHTVMEKYYDLNIDPDDQVGDTKYKKLTFTQDMFNEQVDPAIVATEKLLDGIDADELVLEQFVQYIPDLCGGTLDMVAVSADEKTILFNDYKFGFNKVKAEGNSQILLAALAASIDPATAHLFTKAEKFIGAITQPKAYGDTSDTWEFSKEELNVFEDRLIAAVDLSELDEPPADTGSQCQWCPAAPYCPEKKLLARSALVLDKTDSTQLAEAMLLVEDVEAWAKAVRKAAHEALERGGNVEGWKLVAKRASRVWADSTAVETKIRNAKKLKLDEGFTLKLKSPAQLEKVCKEKKIPFAPFADMAVMFSSGNTMAAASDKRPAVGVAAIPDSMLKLMEGSK
jgi:hypothetical protein